MSIALAQRLVASGSVSAADAEAALLSSLATRIPFVRALIDTGAIAEAVLDRELEALGGIPLRQVAGMPELVNRLPPHFCRRMGVLPVRVDHGARVVEVAAADPLDPHVAAEVSFHLGVPVRVLRAPMSSIEDAIRRIELEAEAAAGRARRATPPFPHGAPDSSNPPPPPPEPPIPLVRKTKDRPPDTLRQYKGTARPGEEGAEDARAPSDADGLSFRPIHPQASPVPEVDSAPGTLRGAAAAQVRVPEVGEGTRSPTQVPQDFGAPPVRSVSESTRLRELAQEVPPETPSRTLRESSPRLRDLVEAPHEERLRDSSTRLRELGQAALGEPAPTTSFAPADAESPVSAMVPPEQVPPPTVEPPAVSFPSLPPPSVLDEPGLLAAEDDWSSAVIAPEPTPEPPRAQRKPSRFARPAIDIQIPQPPSERARRRRSIWDVPLTSEGEPEPIADDAELNEPTPEPPAPLPIRPDLLDVGPALEGLRVAGSRDDVVAAALRGLRTVGRRAAVFVVRRDGFHGWACNVELGDLRALRAVSIPHDAPSLFATAVAAGSYFGPVPPNAVHAGLLAALEQPVSDVAAAVVRAGGKPVMVLFADDLVDIKRRVLPRLLEIANAVGAALSRLLAARL